MPVTMSTYRTRHIGRGESDAAIGNDSNYGQEEPTKSGIDLDSIRRTHRALVRDAQLHPQMNGRDGGGEKHATVEIWKEYVSNQVTTKRPRTEQGDDEDITQRAVDVEGNGSLVPVRQRPAGFGFGYRTQYGSVRCLSEGAPCSSATARAVARCSSGSQPFHAQYTYFLSILLRAVLYVARRAASEPNAPRGHRQAQSAVACNLDPARPAARYRVIHSLCAHKPAMADTALRHAAKAVVLAGVCVAVSVSPPEGNDSSASHLVL
ncbi:hypothetical protein EXIGLDRAFT_704975 [Exidia glandulosa HHB12029]|uniref:Uncharacterized protein n=1 Tax=Exidia glandulosa HHB12029 TaxID=1314781 RepID=A0A165BH08_EXIGL|nr:hypothetical protein EXIGLDRAFT_704975 [Exidia glandulosa HHB12029]